MVVWLRDDMVFWWLRCEGLGNLRCFCKMLKCLEVYFVGRCSEEWFYRVKVFML